MIELQNICFEYGSEEQNIAGRGALHNINLHIPDGQIVLLCGESGCGKTTITRLLNGLIPHFYEGNLTGTICIDGKEINDQPLYETALLSGTVFQNPRSQFFNVDTTSELAFGLENRGMEETQILKKVDKTVQELQLEKLMNRSIFDLSGGEKQKIACGCVSVCSPNIIILDEPSANLDLKSMEQLHVMIEKWKVEHKTVVIAEHRLAYIWNLIDRMVFLKEGKIEFDFSKEEMQKLTPRDLHQMGLRSNQDVKMVHYNRNENIDRIVFKNFVFGYEKNHNILNLKIMEIDKNSITAIVGNNGIGKSTFLRCICGLERKCKGIMEIDGKVYKRKERLNEIFLVMQDVNHQLFTESVLDEVLILCLGMLVASLAAASVVKYQITMLQCEAGYYTACGKRIEIAEHMRYLPMGYFNQNSLGQITNITTNTMEQLADVATRVVMMTTGGVLTSSVITVMMLIFDIRIGFIAMVGMVLFFTVNSFLQRKSKALAPVKAASDEFVVEKVLEYVQGISEVRSYNLTGCASKELNEAIDKNRDINTTMELKTVPWMQLQSIILKLMGVAIILTSCGFYLAGSMTLQNCIGMIICSFLVFESLGSAGNYSTLLRVVDISVSKVENVMKIKEMDIDGKDIIPKNFDIDVENVDFYYDENHAEDAKIINHLSVHIPERTTTAIVGPSGGGKTTLCHLISRFWDVSNGNISLGGENVRNYSVDSLMKNFSFVFQNVYLFEDTIANNIRFGQPEASMELVMDAAKKACCHDFIMELPNGYDTVIGEGGTSLSGGEKQRISIARAIMKDAPVIILDEATANVDPENEKELMSAIEALTKEKTILMIAHRLKTVEHADQILVLDKGQIVQQGRHSELLKQTGIYRKFILEREEAVGWKI